MNVLSVFPLLSCIFGLLLVAFILFNKSGLGKDSKIRYVLSSLVFIYAITSLDYYLTINHQINALYSGLSYFLYHFEGLFFFYFIALYTKTEINLKKWLPIVIGYTILRVLAFVPFEQPLNIQDFVASLETSNYEIVLVIEYLLVSSINIILMFFAYKKLNQTPLIIELNENQKLHYKWIKIIMIVFVLLQIVVFVNTVIGSFDVGNYDFYMKFETMVYALFFFIFAFSIMHFPVFAYSGNFEDLSKEIIQKYAKSSLSDSSELFNKIKAVVKDEELYLDFDLKLNTVAEKLDKSVHHISQAINQNAQMSFPDFINTFRIEKAKKKLLMPKPDTIFAISLDVGFNSKAAFYSAFKKFTSQTPTEFKKANKKKTF